MSNSIITLGLIALGVYLIFTALQSPCEPQSITSIVNSGFGDAEQITKFSPAIDRTLCVTTDPKAVVMFAIGLITLWTLVPRLLKEL